MGKKKKRNRRKKNTSHSQVPSASAPGYSGISKAQNIKGVKHVVSPEKAENERCQGAREFANRNFQLAINHFTRAIALYGGKNPDLAFLILCFTDRAGARLHMKAFTQAIEDCEMALKLDASYWRALVLRGLSKFCVRNYSEAISDFKHALDGQMYGADEQHLGKLRDDISVLLEESLPPDGIDGETVSALPASWLACAQFCDREALRDFDVRKDGDPFAIEADVGRTESSTTGIALPKLIRCPLLIPIGEPLGSLTDKVSQASAEEESFREKEKGNEAFVDEEYEKALLHYSLAISLNSRESVFYSNRALVYLRLHRYQEAISDCTASIDRKPGIKAFARRGLGWAGLHEHVLACCNFKEALQFEPHNQDCLENLRKSLHWLQRELAERVATNPEDAQQQWHLAGVEADLRRTLLVLGIKHVKPQAYKAAGGEMGEDHHKNVKPNPPRADLGVKGERYPKVVPSQPLKAGGTAKDEERRGRNVRSDRNITSKPRRHDIIKASRDDYAAGRASREDYAAAIAHFTSLIAVDKGDIGAFLGRAHALEQQGDLHGALADLQAAIKLDPENKNAHAVYNLLKART